MTITTNFPSACLDTFNSYCEIKNRNKKNLTQLSDLTNLNSLKRKVEHLQVKYSEDNTLKFEEKNSLCLYLADLHDNISCLEKKIYSQTDLICNFVDKAFNEYFPALKVTYKDLKSKVQKGFEVAEELEILRKKINEASKNFLYQAPDCEKRDELEGSFILLEQKTELLANFNVKRNLIFCINESNDKSQQPISTTTPTSTCPNYLSDEDEEALFPSCDDELSFDASEFYNSSREKDHLENITCKYKTIFYNYTFNSVTSKDVDTLKSLNKKVKSLADAHAKDCIFSAEERNEVVACSLDLQEKIESLLALLENSLSFDRINYLNELNAICVPLKNKYDFLICEYVSGDYVLEKLEDLQKEIMKEIQKFLEYFDKLEKEDEKIKNPLIVLLEEVNANIKCMYTAYGYAYVLNKKIPKVLAPLQIEYECIYTKNLPRMQLDPLSVAILDTLESNLKNTYNNFYKLAISQEEKDIIDDTFSPLKRKIADLISEKGYCITNSSGNLYQKQQTTNELLLDSVSWK